MKQLTLLFVYLLLSTSCISIDSYNEAVTQKHSVEEIHHDIDKLYKQLQRLHPRLFQFTPKPQLDFKFDSLKQAITKPMTSREFYKQLAQVTKYVGQGHMTVAPPSTRFKRKERRQRAKTTFAINNLDTEYLDDALFICHAREKDSVLINAEILAVNDEDVKGLLKEYQKYVASDGYNTTLHPRIVGYRFFRFYQYDKGRFDSISLRLRNSDSTFNKTFKRILKEDITVSKDSTLADSVQQNPLKKRLAKAEKQARKLKFKKERRDRKTYGYNYTTKSFNRALSFKGKDNSVAVMQIKGFSSGKYKWFYDEAFQKIDSAKSENLIIDLRNNFGGRLSEIHYLASYLTDKEFTFINPSEVNTRQPVLKTAMSNSTSVLTKIFAGLFSPFIATHNLLKTSKKDGQLYYNFKASKPIEPKPLNFKGSIYVLINGNSFSASSVLSTYLKGSQRATFVGEETGGAYNGTVAGLYKTYQLPNTKVFARIGLMHIDSKFKTAPDGYGIKPDVKLNQTYQDRLNAMDPELEWVLKDIEEKG